MVPLFQRIFQSVNKEIFVFRYLEADETETKILEGTFSSSLFIFFFNFLTFSF